MSHVDVPQGGSANHRIQIKSGGTLTDPDSNSVTVSVVTPASGSNAPTVTSPATRISTGVYETTITAGSTTTLSNDLDSGEDWKVLYDFAVNGVTPKASDRTFKFEVVVAATVSETGKFTTATSVRRGFLERREHQTGKTGSTLTLRRRNAKEILSLKKNDSELALVTGTPVTGEFSFEEPQTITLGDDAVSSDEFVVEIGTYFDDDKINEYIDDVHATLTPKLRTVYSLPFSSTPPILAEIERALVQWAMVVQLEGYEDWRPGASQKEAYQQAAAQAKADFEMILNGDIQLEDGAGSVISRLDIATDDETMITFESSATGGNDNDCCGVLF